MLSVSDHDLFLNHGFEKVVKEGNLPFLWEWYTLWGFFGMMDIWDDLEWRRAKKCDGQDTFRRKFRSFRSFIPFKRIRQVTCANLCTANCVRTCANVLFLNETDPSQMLHELFHGTGHGTREKSSTTTLRSGAGYLLIHRHRTTDGPPSSILWYLFATCSWWREDSIGKICTVCERDRSCHTFD